MKKDLNVQKQNLTELLTTLKLQIIKAKIVSEKSKKFAFQLKTLNVIIK